jgi:hypothetical protein
MTERVVFLWPLPLECRLGFAVSRLLTPVRADSVPPMMPYYSRGAEAECPAARLQTPADINVVARRAELRIEPADRLEAVCSKRRVATRDVLRDFICQQHVRRAARRVRDALGDRTIAGRGDVRATDACVIGRAKRVRQIL